MLHTYSVWYLLQCMMCTIVRSMRECRNVRSVITYICISVQVRFLKNCNFWKIKSSIISIDRQIRNYLGNYCRNDAKQSIHPPTRLVLATMWENNRFLTCHVPILALCFGIRSLTIVKPATNDLQDSRKHVS